MEIILYSIKYYVIHSNGVYGMAYARPMLKNSVSTVLLINKARFINNQTIPATHCFPLYNYTISYTIDKST